MRYFVDKRRIPETTWKSSSSLFPNDLSADSYVSQKFDSVIMTYGPS